MNEFLTSSQKVPALITQERLSRKAGKEIPDHDGDKWQWLYRFPNGLGASVVRFHLKPPGEQDAEPSGWQSTAEVAIIRWNDDLWKPLRNTNRRVPETDLEIYLGMIRDIPLEDVSRLTKR